MDQIHVWLSVPVNKSYNYLLALHFALPSYHTVSFNCSPVFEVSRNMRRSLRIFCILFLSIHIVSERCNHAIATKSRGLKSAKKERLREGSKWGHTENTWVPFWTKSENVPSFLWPLKVSGRKFSASPTFIAPDCRSKAAFKSTG